MLPANFQIHLDYSLKQRFMMEFTVSHCRRLIDITAKEINDIDIDKKKYCIYLQMYGYNILSHLIKMTELLIIYVRLFYYMLCTRLSFSKRYSLTSK